MTRPKKVSLLIFSHVLLAISGGVLGYYAHERLVLSFAFVDEAAVVSRAALLMDVQRVQGNDNDYKEALKSYLQVLRKYKHEGSDQVNKKIYSIDETLTYVRLARIEEREGNTSEVDTYSKRAIVSCGGTGWKDCSKETLWSLAAQLEERGGLKGSSEPQGTK